MNMMTSFVIGALLLLSMVFLQIRMHKNSIDTTFTAMSGKSIEMVGDMIEWDFRKMGMGASGYSYPVLDAQSTSITFMADLDNDHEAEMIQWKFDSTGVSPPNTPNPNDHYIIRTIDSNPDTIHAVTTSFRLRYRLGSGLVVSNPSASQLEQIRHIIIELVCESPEQIDDSTYTVSSWQKQFAPPNLQF